MTAVQIKKIKLGEGLPKICVPLTDRDAAGLKTSLEAMRGRHFQLIEWRADKLSCLNSGEPGKHSSAQHDIKSGCSSLQLTHENTKPASSMSLYTELDTCAKLIRDAFPDIPVIFTVRTSRDMESFEIDDEVYAELLSYAAEARLGDIIDVEYSRGPELVSKLVNDVQAHGIKVIVSQHYREHTPAEDMILDTLHGMQETGADIVKYAAMPQSDADVLALLNASFRYSHELGSIPMITMSMGQMGVISRISGALTGSCLTFGTVGSASAPGQIDCDELWQILNLTAIQQ